MYDIWFIFKLKQLTDWYNFEIERRSISYVPRLNN